MERYAVTAAAASKKQNQSRAHVITWVDGDAFDPFRYSRHTKKIEYAKTKTGDNRWPHAWS
jgi:hypothetical protein